MIRDLGVRSLLDIPCGDFFWMKEVDLDLESYVGADVVSSLIEGNNQRYGSPDRMFLRLDILTDELPRADLVLCRDCLDHLSLANARRALENLVRSGSTYLLATTYTERDVNPDIQSGDWRPLNLEASPFCLPPPMEMINEGSSKPKYPDKSLGLWKIADVARATRRAQGDTARGT